ncbi:anti-sigma 24 factor [Pseudothauera nasutitermitis]|uniref:Anti-sigma 24 factor n=1 Tax=Pseudothauera nasutitermitis TaxID=2565930 RepID=A0A4S4B3N6_9RHOO|nr:sigma-E factor negative regulatory protein [Pseudothauera nasutitermitis]THF67175.1 anti-sigma 24 factor [Pseudothauera nasutitermitis]
MKDKLSTLLDGGLDEPAMNAMFDTLRRDPSAREDWNTYCLIGDVLRGEHGGPEGFVDRVMAVIEDEPVVFVPALAASAERRRGLWQSMMPLAASVMGVTAVGWVAYTLSAQDAAVRPEVAVVTVPGASSSAVLPVAQAAERSAPNVVEFRAAPQALNDPHREYVFVHQAMSGGGPIPGAVQYVRSVSDVRAEGGR